MRFRQRVGWALAVSVAVIVGLVGIGVAAPANVARRLSVDGTVTIEYSGTATYKFVYQPSDPAVWQAKLAYKWDEIVTIELLGGKQNTPTEKLLGSSLSVSGTTTESFAPPNAQRSCSGTLSARPGAKVPIFLTYTGSQPDLRATAIPPNNDNYVVSSAPPSTDCGSFGGVGSVPPSSEAAFSKASSPEAFRNLPSPPFTRRYTANGSDAQNTDSLTTTFSVSPCTTVLPGGRVACSRCPPQAAAAGNDSPAAVAAAGKLIVRATGPKGYKNNFNGTRVSFTLVGHASGGCRPYRYKWRLDKAPAGSTVTPSAASGQMLSVTALCPRRIRKNGVIYVPASCDTQPLKYTVTVTDANRATAQASRVILLPFSKHLSYYSPGTPAERVAWIKTLTGMNNALATQCAQGSTVNDILKTGADFGSWGGLNPVPGLVSTPASTAAACSQIAVNDVTTRFINGASALRAAKLDPPSPAYASVAVPRQITPAPAPRCTGARAALCEHIASGAQAADYWLVQAIAIADTVATTIDRHSGAVYAGDQQAAQLQDDNYRAGLAEVAQVVGLDNQARRSLATLLRSHRLNFVFRRAFTSRPVVFLQRAAARLNGAKRALVDAMLGSLRLFTPSIGASYVRDLLAPISTSGLTTPGSLAPRDVAALVAQLAGQGQINGALARTLEADLAAVPTAAGPPRTSALAQLGADLQKCSGGVRPLLLAASGLAIAP